MISSFSFASFPVESHLLRIPSCRKQLTGLKIIRLHLYISEILTPLMLLNILVCGGGCADPSLAFWLARAGHRVTVIERFPALRASGA